MNYAKIEECTLYIFCLLFCQKEKGKQSCSAIGYVKDFSVMFQRLLIPEQ